MKLYNTNRVIEFEIKKCTVIKNKIKLMFSFEMEKFLNINLHFELNEVESDMIIKTIEDHLKQIKR